MSSERGHILLGFLETNKSRFFFFIVFSGELKELNADITERITTIEQKQAGARVVPTREIVMAAEDGGPQGSLVSQMGEDDTLEDLPQLQPEGLEDDMAGSEENKNTFPNFVPKGANKLVKGGLDNVKGGLKNVKGVAGAAVNLVTGNEDGEPYSAGFVSFKTLSTTNAARQMVHHFSPFNLEVAQAPDPDDVFWANVGRSHKELQLGNLASRAATLAICLLWTIPMAFISSLSSVEGLKKQFSWLEDPINEFPIIESILEVLAPFFVIVVNGMLPTILQTLSMFEGPVSGSVVVASTFTKLAMFMIVQTFFVSLISGSLMKQLEAIIDDYTKIIDILAKSLPSQSTYFIQISFVGTVMFLVFEMLRVTPLAMAFIRRFVGPKITEKQRRTTFFGIRPLGKCR